MEVSSLTNIKQQLVEILKKYIHIMMDVVANTKVNDDMKLVTSTLEISIGSFLWGDLQRKRSAPTHSSSPNVARGVIEVRWDLPRPSRIRDFVNFASANGVNAVAAVFYDADGNVMVFGATKIESSSVLKGELEALLFRVQLALDLHLDGESFSNCHPLVQSLVDCQSRNWNLAFSYNNFIFFQLAIYLFVGFLIVA
uniref:Uncharacterized protein n=1 Tax=Cannabis sativa TaxID=3483 RepID=A0A803QNP2_CANSA